MLEKDLIELSRKICLYTVDLIETSIRATERIEMCQIVHLTESSNYDFFACIIRIKDIHPLSCREYIS